jgi:alkylation response protein AidB-like acyl-CoA dehydrogenase
MHDIDRFEAFLRESLSPRINRWYRRGSLPREFFEEMGTGGWLGIRWADGRLHMDSCLRRSLILEALAKVSPGSAIAALAHVDLGFAGLFLYGSPALHAAYGPPAARGDLILCLGNTEGRAGSDVAAVRMTAVPEAGGWRLNGTKSYVTNGAEASLAVITAVTDPEERRNRRLSMFLVNLESEGVARKKLDKRVWIPSDLTRITLKDVFVPHDHLLGRRREGLRQVLTIFTHSRTPISALTLGTAAGAFDLAVDRASRRYIFGRPIMDFQAKAFEAADLYAHLAAARLMTIKAARSVDEGGDFRLDASMAKYLSVAIARRVTAWAADLFGAVSVVFEHPIHKFPLDAWASSIGEGSQDVQKLVIFREMMAQHRSGPSRNPDE